MKNPAHFYSRKRFCGGNSKNMAKINLCFPTQRKMGHDHNSEGRSMALRRFRISGVKKWAYLCVTVSVPLPFITYREK